MRVLVTLLALVTAPFLASVSQEPAGSSRPDARSGHVEDQDNDDRDHCWNGEHDAARATHSQGHGHHWAKGHAKHACVPPVGDGGGGGGTGGGTGGGGATTCLVGTGLANIAGMSWWDANGNTWQDNPV